MVTALEIVRFCAGVLFCQGVVMMIAEALSAPRCPACEREGVRKRLSAVMLSGSGVYGVHLYLYRCRRCGGEYVYERKGFDDEWRLSKRDGSEHADRPEWDDGYHAPQFALFLAITIVVAAVATAALAVVGPSG